MAKKRKNSNYATEKNRIKALNKEKQKRNREIKQKALIVSIFVVGVAVLALAIWGILALIAKNHDPDEGHNHGSESSSTVESSSQNESKTGNEDLAVTHHASIKIEGYDEVVHVELYGEEAPITVANFVKLANEGFYDGLTFHRIVSNIVQGGDTNGDGVGGSDENIKGEFSLNGVENKVNHSRGVISMARTGNDYNSASSQFFILTSAVPGYNGSYAAFGQVTSGMDVIDDLASRFESNSIPYDRQPVIESITIHENH